MNLIILIGFLVVSLCNDYTQLLTWIISASYHHISDVAQSCCSEVSLSCLFVSFYSETAFILIRNGVPNVTPGIHARTARDEGLHNGLCCDYLGCGKDQYFYQQCPILGDSYFFLIQEKQLLLQEFAYKNFQKVPTHWKLIIYLTKFEFQYRS